MRYRRIAFKIFIAIFFLTLTSTHLWSGEPGEVVKEIILKDASLKEAENTKERKVKNPPAKQVALCLPLKGDKFTNLTFY